MRELKDVIKELRQKHGNKTQVAKKIGISSQLLGQYEIGRQEPKIEFFEKWAEVFHEDIRAIQKQTNVSHETKNGTHVDKPSDNKEKPLRVPEEVYRDLVESNSEYRLVPKVILEGKYVMVLENQIGKTEEALWTALRAKDDLIKDLKEEIAIYRASRTTAKERK